MLLGLNLLFGFPTPEDQLTMEVRFPDGCSLNRWLSGGHTDRKVSSSNHSTTELPQLCP